MTGAAAEPAATPRRTRWRASVTIWGVVAELPGPAYAVGFSSGAVLAVEAALTGVAIAGLA